MGLLDLFKPGYLASDPEKRIKAISGISDQKLLSEIAISDSSPRVRVAAVGKIDDQQALMKIALEGKQIDSRIAAVERITSQEDLAQIIKTRKNARLMGACFSRITDRNILERIAEDPECNITARRIAVLNYADESYLADIGLADDKKESERVKTPEEIELLIKKYGARQLVRAFGKFRGSVNAVRALGMLLDRGKEPAEGAIDYLVLCLTHANSEVRSCAADQLATLNDSDLISYLILKMDSAQHHDRIMEVLRRIDHPEAGKVTGE
jgi:hypothetical protein